MLASRYHRGVFVTRFDEAVVREQHELHGALNGIASARAAANPTPRVLAELDSALRSMRASKGTAAFQDAAYEYRRIILDEDAGPRLHLASADIIARQRIRSQFAAHEPSLSFVGDPSEQPSGAVEGLQSVVTGVGASPGRARGRARVITNPASPVALGADDVLIAHTTDPSWVMTFMTVAGMAIDVGGTLSHAAIIARELGIPCVIGTASGTRVIPEGALVEIDGSKGTVRILDATGRSGIA